MEMGGAEIGTIEISRYMKKKGWNVIVASSGGSLVNKLDIKNILHIKLPLKSKNPLIIFFNIFRIAWVIKKNKVKIVHLRSRAPAWSAYYACLMFRGIKIVSTILLDCLFLIVATNTISSPSSILPRKSYVIIAPAPTLVTLILSISTFDPAVEQNKII